MIEIAGGILLALFLIATIQIWLPLVVWLLIIGAVGVVAFLLVVGIA